MHEWRLYLVPVVDGNLSEIVPQIQNLCLVGLIVSIDHNIAKGVGTADTLQSLITGWQRDVRHWISLPYFPLTAASCPLYSTRNQPFGKVNP